MATDRQKDAAREIITRFENNQRAGWFTGFSRPEVAASLKIRVADPITINQQDTMLCGVAAFLYVLANDQPEKYVKLVTDLFDNGRSYISEANQKQSGIWITPDDHLKHYRPNKHASALSPADWIAMASLRDSKNWLLDYETINDGAYAGGTSPSDIATWLKKFGGYDQIVDRGNPWFAKENNLYEANGYYMDKFRTFINVHSDMFNKSSSTWSLAANHWVVLDSPIKIGRLKIEMTVYTWGYKTKNAVVWKQDFLDHYYGFVAAKY